MNPQCSRILVCRTDHIGDVVLTLPMLAGLKQHFPGARVDVLCSAVTAPMVRRCRHVDAVLVYAAPEQGAGLFAGGRYDTVIFVYPNRVLALAARRAGVAHRVGTSHRLYHWFSCNRLAHFGRVRSPLHEAQLNFALLRPLGIARTPTLAELPAMFGLSAPRHSEVDALFAARKYNVILHPKSNGNGREWSLVRYQQLARALQVRDDIGLWITGSAAEGELIARHAPQLLALENVGNLCGRVDLDGLMALIGACDGLVASGTGPMHLSAALGRPTLGLFPPLRPIDPARWGALGERARSLTGKSDCRACRDANRCACMDAISADAVADVVLEWCA